MTNDADLWLQDLMTDPSRERPRTRRPLAGAGSGFARETGASRMTRGDEFLARADGHQFTVCSSAIRSASGNALCISCVTTSTVMPKPRFRNRMSSSSPGATIGSSPAEGSSKTRISGSRPSAPGDRGALLHPARQLVRKEVALVGQADGLELHPDHEGDDRIGQLRQLLERQGDVLGNRHRTEQSRPLKCDADAPANRGQLGCGTRGDVHTVHEDRARVWFREAQHLFQQGGLSGSAAAEEHEDFAAIHLEVDPVQHPPLAVARREASDRDHRVLADVVNGVIRLRSIPSGKHRRRHEIRHDDEKRGLHDRRCGRSPDRFRSTAGT